MHSSMQVTILSKTRRIYCISIENVSKLNNEQVDLESILKNESKH